MPTSTFSTRFISGNSRMFWNVRATPALASRSGVRRCERQIAACARHPTSPAASAAPQVSHGPASRRTAGTDPSAAPHGNGSPNA
jgi:hypothetical protein